MLTCLHTQCNIPHDANHKVRDFFKPVNGANFCEMLQSNTKHQWSREGLNWITPAFYTFDLGGSADNWLKQGNVEDERMSLSFWGTNYGSRTGGCCSSSTALYRTFPSLAENGAAAHWGQSCT